jgi:hypothetical protein
MKSRIESVAIEGKEGVATLLTGNHIIQLEDESTQTMHTQDPESFLLYANKFSNDEHHIVYGEDSINLVKKKPGRYNEPLASCRLSHSNLLRHVDASLDSDMSPGNFEKFLSKMKRNLDETGRDVLFNVKDLKIAKVTNIQRSQDRKGNYIFNISRESKKDSGDYEPPETFSTKVPVFNYLNNEENLVDIPLDFNFDYTENHGAVTIMLCVSCPQLDDILLYQKKKIIESVIEEAGFDAYFGQVNAHTHTSEWRHKVNGQSDKEERY